MALRRLMLRDARKSMCRRIGVSYSGAVRPRGSLQVGIVGLPNVGKSTLYNALNQNANAAEAANFPFATIEPNRGAVAVPDRRLDEAARLAKSAKAVPTAVEFVDIAGLVKGASKGEGLGNKFLSHIRQVDSVVHVVRCFEDPQIAHVDGSVDPARDVEVIDLELTLADIEQCEKRLEKLGKRAKSKEEQERNDFEKSVIEERVLPNLRAGTPARVAGLSEEERKAVYHLFLLTMKPVIYAANLHDSELSSGNPNLDSLRQIAAKQGAEVVAVSAQVEAELAEIEDEEERASFLEELGVDGSGLSNLVQAAYRQLGLLTFFTAGEKEARAWTVRQGACAPEAAGQIHSDMQRGFICAETVSFDDFVRCNGWDGAKEEGKLRQEGKDYVVQDGDVMTIRFNV